MLVKAMDELQSKLMINWCVHRNYYYYVPVNVYPHYPPPGLPEARPGDFDISLIKSLYRGAKLLIKFPYFCDHIVSITKDL